MSWDQTMLSNSGLTSSQPFIGEQGLKLVGWNIMSDADVHKYPPQAQRIGQLATTMRQIDGDIAFWCEGESPELLAELAEESNLVLVGGAKQYGKLGEHMVFAVKQELAKDAEVSHVINGAIAMKLAGVTWIGIHMPHRIFRDHSDRTKLLHAVPHMSNLRSDPTALIGDFNMVPGLGLRRELEHMGLSEVHHDQPYFPNPSYRTMENPALMVMPKMALDGTMITYHIEATDMGYVYSPASDHGAQYATLSVPGSNLHHQDLLALASLTN